MPWCSQHPPARSPKTTTISAGVGHRARPTSPRSTHGGHGPAYRRLSLCACCLFAGELQFGIVQIPVPALEFLQESVKLVHGAVLALRRPGGGDDGVFGLGVAVPVAARLDALAVDARGAVIDAAALLAGVVDVDDVEGVDVAGDVAVVVGGNRVSARAGVEEGGKEGGLGGAYPSSVRQMLIRTSAPQPATSTTPTGGTGSC